jgi:cephalosporin hydroxylase
MKLIIDDTSQELMVETPGAKETMPLYSDRAFELISALHLKVGWNQKHSYSFTWLGRPIIQLPEDVLRIQEVIFRVRPELIVETGVAHGGSVVFYASLCELLGRGRVIGIDIEIRAANRAAIEQHAMFKRIELIEGSSIAPEVVALVARRAAGRESTLVILDSNHTYEHVRRELEAYAPIVSVGSYVVVADGVMRDLADTPRGRPEWVRDNPAQAVFDFAAAHPEFLLEQPEPPFNESTLHPTITYWPHGYLRRLR